MTFTGNLGILSVMDERETPKFTAEERALWDKIVADYILTPHAREMMETIMVKSKPKDERVAVTAALMTVANFASNLALAVLHERQKHFSK